MQKIDFECRVSTKLLGQSFNEEDYKTLKKIIKNDSTLGYFKIN